MAFDPNDVVCYQLARRLESPSRLRLPIGETPLARPRIHLIDHADAQGGSRSDLQTVADRTQTKRNVPKGRTPGRSARVTVVLIGLMALFSTHDQPAHAQTHPVPIHRSQRQVLVSDECNKLEFDFFLGLTDVLDNLEERKKYAPHEFYWRHLTQNAKFLRHHDAAAHALQDKIREHCAPAFGFQLRNAEQEEIYMWQARAISFHLTDTNIYPPFAWPPKVCTKHERNLHDLSFRCVGKRDAEDIYEATAAMLYEGRQKLSFTSHEFWLMFRQEYFRNKATFYFVYGTPLTSRHDPSEPWRFQEFLRYETLVLFQDYFRDRFAGKIAISERTRNPL